VDSEKLRRPHTFERQKDNEYKENVYMSKIINYVNYLHLTNARYHYLGLVRKGKTMHLWYDTDLKEQTLIEKTSDGFELRLLDMTDDYMLGLHGDNINSFINSSILKDEELKKWHELKADDNPVLIKYYFKKD
jgi:hypothetical protein